MKGIIKNWRTTVAGVVTILAGSFYFIEGDKNHAIELLTLGIGLIAAKDGIDHE